MSLPALLRVEDFPGADYAEKWKAFLEAIYQVFLQQVVRGGLRFQGLPVRCRYHPPYDGKHAAFWHLMSEGKVEEDRTPDLERCARMRWIAWVIQNADNPQIVRWWKTERTTSHGTKTRVPLWFVEGSYTVILEKRPAYYLLITTYCLKPNQLRRFQQEWDAWKQK